MIPAFSEEEIRDSIENDIDIQHRYRMVAEIGYIYELLLDKGLINEEDLKDHDEYVNETVKKLTEDSIQNIIEKEKKKEVTKISEDEWMKARNHTVDMLMEGQAIGPTGMFYVIGCRNLLERYDRGERTKELYDEMIDLH